VNQGISLETMRASWDQAPNAISYEAQWRRNDGDWVNVPRSSTTSFECRPFTPDVILCVCGRLTRLKFPLAGDIQPKHADRENGKPAETCRFIATGLTGIRLNWGFPANTADTLKTEIQYTANSDFSDPFCWLMCRIRLRNTRRWACGQGRSSGTARNWWTKPGISRVIRTGSGASNDNADDYLGDIAKISCLLTTALA
jgi:hypothetical protein